MLHPEAKALIQARMQDTARERGEPYEPERPDNLHRLNMGVFPQGATLIPNPYNKIPGFSCVGMAPDTAAAVTPSAARPPEGASAPLGGSATGEAVKRGGIHFTPGFPVMAWPMIEWVLDTNYRHWFSAGTWQERSVIILGAMEGTLTPVMQRVEAAHPQVKVFSLPSVDHPQYGAHIDLGVKGAPEAVAPAYADLRRWLEPFGLRYGPEIVRP